MYMPTKPLPCPRCKGLLQFETVKERAAVKVTCTKCHSKTEVTFADMAMYAKDIQ